MNKVAYLAVLAMLAAGGAHAASFNCAKAKTADEKAICGNLALNDADVKMATMFEMESKLLAMGARAELQDSQKEWIEKRNQCKGSVKCLTDAYTKRLGELDNVFGDIASRGPI